MTVDRATENRTQASTAAGDQHAREWLPLILAWLVVLVPSAWGVWQVVRKSTALFR